MVGFNSHEGAVFISEFTDGKFVQEKDDALAVLDRAVNKMFYRGTVADLFVYTSFAY